MNATPGFLHRHSPAERVSCTEDGSQAHHVNTIIGYVRHQSGLSGKSERAGPIFPTIVRRFLIGFLPVIALTAIAWPYIPRQYEAYAVVVLRPSDADAVDGARGWRQTLDENAIESEIEHIRSRRLADVVIAKHELLSDPEFAPAGGFRQGVAQYFGQDTPTRPTEAEVRQRLLDHLSVWRERKTYTVTLGYRSNDPKKAASMTQTLLTAYLDDQVARKRAADKRVDQSFQAEVLARGAAYRKSLGRAEEFIEEAGLVDTGEQVAIDNQLATLSTEAAQTRARVIEATVRLESLRERKKSGDLDNAPEVLASPTVMRLKENLAAAMSKSAVLGSETRAISAEIEAEANRIVRAAEIELADLRSREAMLEQEIGNLRGRLVERRRNEMRLEELRRQASFDKQVYEEALKRMHAHRGRPDTSAPDAEIVTKPEEPLNPAFPRPLLTLLASLALASMAGIFTARHPLAEAAKRSGLLVAPSLEQHRTITSPDFGDPANVTTACSWPRSAAVHATER